MQTTKRSSFVLMMMVMLMVIMSVTGAYGATSGKRTINIRVGAGHTATGTPWTYGVNQFLQPNVSKRVFEETDFEIEWTEAYGGSLAKLGEELVAVEGGLLDMGVVCPPFEPTKLMLHGMLLRMPFQSPDPLIVAEVVKELYDEFPIFKTTFEDYNQKYLAILVTDDYNLFTNFEVSKVDDLRGRKIAGAGANLKWIEGTGAIGVQSNLAEGYTSLQTGVYDGFLNPTSSQFKYKIHEVGPYLLLAHFGVQVGALLTANNDFLNRLPEDVRNIILEESEKVIALTAQRAKDEYEEALAGVRAENVTVTELSQEEKVRWANLLPNVVGDDLAKELNSKGYPGNEIITAFYAKLKARGYETVREWQLP